MMYKTYVLWLIWSIGLWVFRVEAITLQEYGNLLQETQLIAEKSLKENNYQSLHKHLTDLPTTIEVTYLKDKTTQTKKVNLGWIKAHYHYHDLVIGDWDKETAQEIKILTEKLVQRLKVAQQELLLLGYQVKNEDEVKKNLANILNKSRFQEKEDQDEGWWKQRMKKIQRWLSENFGSLKKLWNWALVLLLLAVLGYVANKAAKYIGNSRDAAEIQQAQGLLQADDPRTSKELAEKAAQFEKEKNFRLAIRYYYIAIIVLLEERQILSYQPFYTNWEYHRHLIKIGYTDTALEYLTRMFDRTWYGYYNVNPEEYQQFLIAYEQSKNILVKVKA